MSRFQKCVVGTKKPDTGAYVCYDPSYIKFPTKQKKTRLQCWEAACGHPGQEVLGGGVSGLSGVTVIFYFLIYVITDLPVMSLL